METLGNSPFTQEVDEAMPPKGFKLPTMESYDGTIDPIDHLEMFALACPYKELAMLSCAKLSQPL